MPNTQRLPSDQMSRSPPLFGSVEAAELPSNIDKSKTEKAVQRPDCGEQLGEVLDLRTILEQRSFNVNKGHLASDKDSHVRDQRTTVIKEYHSDSSPYDSDASDNVVLEPDINCPSYEDYVKKKDSQGDCPTVE